jgi:hypothetical protein
MRAVALEHGDGTVTEMDRETIVSAGAIVLGLDEVDVDALAPVDPSALAAGVDGPEQAEQAVRMLAVMSLADGVADAGKTALVRSYAEALGVRAGYLEILAEVAEDEVAQATACMVRKNAESFPHLDSSRLGISAIAPFFPYRDAPDPELEARYKALGELPPDTFGHAFYEHFHRNGFEFPGNPNGLAEGFTTPHDSSHVLSGYSTKEMGELCVSTFIGAMHPDHPMAAEVLPVVYSWHLGVKLNDIANSSHGAFEPRHFWTAWERGAATNGRRRRRRLGLLGRDPGAAGGAARPVRRTAGRPAAARLIGLQPPGAACCGQHGATRGTQPD